MARCRQSRSRSSPATFTFLERSALGVLRQEVLELILDFGLRTRAAGVTHVTVLERDLPLQLQDSSLARQARGWIVLVSDDERLITCYRRGDASGFIRRKPKHRLNGGRPHPNTRTRRARDRHSTGYRAG
ncbi:hypothetical protein HUA74_02065 [Myxococcus sp. CA051A]|uniref:Uncharacterized protein n=1 Tax=Myxococcus llanfairpwllgwyngyllgogerychwyrndrobwllllantysiliogogogochensis TaxID=2590453 RepID=A0A540WUW3_9BACT|nr:MULTISPECIES: hypothetical protein [Myxococcus]NTX00859.1 hypothetical protein [Myxococcus sp. CA040A]NTX12436.1 hypothetical protein [Myxococcus sp. CA056]NTX33455.1 hypothetical protein [Myxococcus sp. CA033]NTX58372.1 hypothetical protein [Myxococcus sp. CA039A]NTX59437.1 hypothetical protein [Myxococcus sp. CA051A]